MTSLAPATAEAGNTARSAPRWRQTFPARSRHPLKERTPAEESYP